MSVRQVVYPNPLSRVISGNIHYFPGDYALLEGTAQIKTDSYSAEHDDQLFFT
jgi:predicted secreted protein